MDDVLRPVSRSFYLSLSLLPRLLRQPISLAYLLARATDTVADTAEISSDVRRVTLAQLSAHIQGGADGDDLAPILRVFAEQQPNDAERTLIESLPLYLDLLDSLGQPDAADVREVLQKIVRGQSLDLERFGEGKGIRVLRTVAELNEYTYLVAGCVGEFWTHIGARHLRRFAQLSEAEMLRLGVEYGQGLQLINILRDVGDDLAAGRCYLPAEELAGLSPEELAAAPESAEPIFRAWRERAAAGMTAGLEYATAIENVRLRIATALPALIGVRTLALLKTTGPRSIAHRVKVPRREVRQIVATTMLTLGSRRTLTRMFQQLSR